MQYYYFPTSEGFLSIVRFSGSVHAARAFLSSAHGGSCEQEGTILHDFLYRILSLLQRSASFAALVLAASYVLSRRRTGDNCSFPWAHTLIALALHDYVAALVYVTLYAMALPACGSNFSGSGMRNGTTSPQRNGPMCC